MSPDEEVLCVEADLLRSLGYFEGFQPNVSGYLNALLLPENQSFQPRRTCETDPSFKQLIPYVLLMSNGGQEPHLFQYTRGKGQGEKRLHALRSIGVGGHISRSDADGNSWYETGLARELDEELILDEKPDCPIVGLIYDPSNEVGQVHLGIVHLMELSGPTARAREADLTDAGFVPLSQIWAEADRLETWSRICLENLLNTVSR